MRKGIAVTALSLLTAVLAGCGSAPSPAAENDQASQGDRVLQVGITQIVEHPSLDTVRQGIIDGLAEEGFHDGQEIAIEFQSAQGEQPIAQQIAQKFATDGKDVIIALSTSSAQAAAQATHEIPIIFGTVTDPVGAALVESLEKPGGNVTGTSDMAPAEEQLSLFAELGTDVKNVGMIYNAGEANSVFNVEQAKQAAEKLGLTITAVTASNPTEVMQAAQSLVGRVDGLYLITDNTLAQGIQSVLSLAEEQGWPTISVEQSYVDQGALATRGYDYYELGKATGRMAAAVLRGADPATMPVQTSDELQLVINAKTAKALGITIPEEIRSHAIIVGE